MKKLSLLIILVFCSLFNVFSQDNKIREVTDRKYYAHGPRIGLTSIYNSTDNIWGVSKDKSFLLDKDIPSIISQFGYHLDLSLYVTNKVNPLVQFDGLIGGIENGFFLPSLSMVVGIRFFDTFELGVGPNLSLSGSGIIFAGGYNIHVDNVYFPVNIVVVKTNDNYRFSILTGFNFF